MKAGLVSVSFRKLAAEEIAKLCVQCELEEIEWGGDIHVPLGDVKAACRVAALTQNEGLHTCCYGSYIRMTKEERPLFASLVETAAALEAPSIRVWAGRSEDADMDEIAESAQMLSEMARDRIITFEFHGNTLTYNAATAQKLMKKIDKPNVLSQWQWPIDLPETECLSSIETMRPWLYNVHVFSWQGRERLPLAAKAESWRQYLPALKGKRNFLLEFVQDDDPQNLVRDARVLREWLKTAEK